MSVFQKLLCYTSYLGPANYITITRAECQMALSASLFYYTLYTFALTCLIITLILYRVFIASLYIFLTMILVAYYMGYIDYACTHLFL